MKKYTVLTKPDFALNSKIILHAIDLGFGKMLENPLGWVESAASPAKKAAYLYFDADLFEWDAIGETNLTSYAETISAEDFLKLTVDDVDDSGGERDLEIEEIEDNETNEVVENKRYIVKTVPNAKLNSAIYSHALDIGFGSESFKGWTDLEGNNCSKAGYIHLCGSSFGWDLPETDMDYFSDRDPIIISATEFFELTKEDVFGKAEDPAEDLPEKISLDDAMSEALGRKVKVVIQ